MNQASSPPDPTAAPATAASDAAPKPYSGLFGASFLGSKGTGVNWVRVQRGCFPRGRCWCSEQGPKGLNAVSPPRLRAHTRASAGGRASPRHPRVPGRAPVPGCKRWRPRVRPGAETPLPTIIQRVGTCDRAPTHAPREKCTRASCSLSFNLFFFFPYPTVAKSAPVFALLK